MSKSGVLVGEKLKEALEHTMDDLGLKISGSFFDAIVEFHKIFGQCFDYIEAEKCKVLCKL